MLKVYRTPAALKRVLSSGLHKRGFGMRGDGD
jgi:hypothetical protein